MSFWPRIVFSVNRRVGDGDEGVELGGGLDLLAALAARPRSCWCPRRAPRGWSPRCTRSSIRSSRFLCHLPEMILVLRHCLLRSSAIVRVSRVVLAFAAGSVLRDGLRPLPRRRFLVLGLLGHPAVVDRAPLLADVLDRLALRRRLARQDALGLADSRARARPSPTRSDRRSRSRRGRRSGAARAYWSGRPKASKGKPARPVEVVPDEVLLGVDAHEPVGHAHVRRRSRSAGAGSR